MLLAFLLRLDK